MSLFIIDKVNRYLLLFFIKIGWTLAQNSRFSITAIFI